MSGKLTLNTYFTGAGLDTCSGEDKGKGKSKGKDEDKDEEKCEGEGEVKGEYKCEGKGEDKGDCEGLLPYLRYSLLTSLPSVPSSDMAR